MTVKQWLRRARSINKEVEQLLIAKQEAYERAIGGAINMLDDKIQISKGNGSENKLINYIEYDFLINKRIDELIACKNEILNAINRLDNSQYRALLIAYYINCRTWEEVAQEMKYDMRHIHRLHGRALKEIGEVLSLP